MNKNDAKSKDVVLRAISFLNNTVTAFVALLILIVICYGCYALYDANVVSSEASAASYAIYNPKISTGGFEELRNINPEVCAWLTVYGTPIDYPVLHGEDNSKYINTDAKGNYSLTGSLFLDHRNSGDFKDFNSIIYGHNMVPAVMFGCIKDFKNAEYFNSHAYGELYYNQRAHGIVIFAMITADAYDDKVYTPVSSDRDKEDYLNNILRQSVNKRNIGEITADDRVVLLSTCSPSDTNGRNILVCKITDEIFENLYEPVAAEMKTADTFDLGEWAGLPWWFWLMAAILLLLLIVALILFISNRRRQKNKERSQDDK